jgi:thymidylate synthase
MRSNDIFYGLTFDAPFFSILQQSVFLKLQETYPELQLGMYYHYADNVHFYERHFELANEIKAENPAANPESSLLLRNPFLDYDGKNVFLTDKAKAFIKEVDDTIEEGQGKGTKQDYKTIIDKYFVTNGE